MTFGQVVCITSHIWRNIPIACPWIITTSEEPKCQRLWGGLFWMLLEQAHVQILHWCLSNLGAFHRGLMRPSKYWYGQCIKSPRPIRILRTRSGHGSKGLSGKWQNEPNSCHLEVILLVGFSEAWMYLVAKVGRKQNDSQSRMWGIRYLRTTP